MLLEMWVNKGRKYTMFMDYKLDIIKKSCFSKICRISTVPIRISGGRAKPHYVINTILKCTTTKHGYLLDIKIDLLLSY